MRKQCACCGGDAGNVKQWWNQDTGYSICARCVPDELKRWGPEQMRECYGVAGVHYLTEAA